MKQTYVAELIGTFILVALGSMAVLGSGGNLVIIAFGFGIALMIALYSVGHISGGHFNPAVSLAMRVGRRPEHLGHDRLLGGPGRRRDPGVPGGAGHGGIGRGSRHHEHFQ